MNQLIESKILQRIKLLKNDQVLQIMDKEFKCGLMIEIQRIKASNGLFYGVRIVPPKPDEILFNTRGVPEEFLIHTINDLLNLHQADLLKIKSFRFLTLNRGILNVFDNYIKGDKVNED